MEDILSKIILIIMIALLVYIVPSLYVNILTSTIARDNARNQTKILIDNAINKGYISKEMYEIYKEIAGLDKEDIYINVKRSIPIIKNEFIEYKDILYTEFTLNKYINEKGKFNFEIGDEVLIMINANYNKHVNVFFERIFGIYLEENCIRYGGIIKNEVI